MLRFMKVLARWSVLPAVVVVAVGGAAVQSALSQPPVGCRTAIAYRDNVPLEQQLGTWAWTLPWLELSYDEVETFTATGGNNKRAELIEALAEADDDACEVDLYFFAHGADYVSWIERAPQVPRLRLVYDTGAGDARQGPRWMKAGASAFVGHGGDNFAPVFFAFFLPAWITGSNVDDAIASANRKTLAVLERLGIDADGRLWRGTEAIGYGNLTRTR